MGEEPAQASATQQLHMKAYDFLSNGMGGVDWQGLGYVIEHLGIEDPAALMDALYTIKTHRPPEEEK